MNNRKKKIAQAKRQARRDIHRILDAVLDINGLQGSEEPHPTVFLDFSGHVGVIEVEFYEDGWRAGKIHVTKEAPVHREPFYKEISLSEMADRLEEERERLA